MPQTQWIDVTLPSSTGIKKKDETQWEDVTPTTYKPPEHPFTGPEEPTFFGNIKQGAKNAWDEGISDIGNVWNKGAHALGAGLTALPPFRHTPEMQKHMEEFNAKHPIAAIPGKFVEAGTQFGTSPLGIAGILSEGAIPALAGIGEAGSLARNAGTIASQVGKGLHEIGGAGMGAAGIKHVVDASIDPNLDNWQRTGAIIEGLLEVEMGKAAAGVYGRGAKIAGAAGALKKIGDVRTEPPPPPPPGGPSNITVGGLDTGPQGRLDFGQPEPMLPFHGEPSMDVNVPFDERFQRGPLGITSRPDVPQTRPQIPRPIEGPEVGPYGTGVGQERLPLTDEFGQGELGLPLTHPEENPSAMPYEPRGPDVVPLSDTPTPDATPQPHVISARGMTKADIEMLRTQGYESGGVGPDNYAQMIRKAGPPPSSVTTPTPTPNAPPPVASGATTTDIRAGQPIRIPKDRLTTEIIERLQAQGIERTGTDANGDGLFTRIIKDTGGWGDDAAMWQFLKDFFEREPTIEERADAAVPGTGRSNLFAKIMGTIHDTRDPNTLRRQVELLDEQKGVALINGEPDAAYNLANLHREASERLLALEGEGAPPGSLPGQNPLGGFQVNSIPGGQPHGPVSPRSITDLSNQINELAIPGTTAPDGLRQQLDSQLYDKLRFERDPEIAKQNLKEVSELRRLAATEGDIERASFNLGVAQDTVEVTSGRWDGISAREDYLHEIAEQIRGNETPESYHHQRYDPNQLVEDARRIINEETDPARMKDNWDQLRAILDNMNRRRENYETRDIIRQLSDQALAKWSQSRPDAMNEAVSRMKYAEEDPRVPRGRSFDDMIDDLHGQLEAGYDVNEEILGEIQDRINSAKDIHDAMDMRSNLGVMVDNSGDPIMRDLYERLWQQADKKYYELVRGSQEPPPQDLTQQPDYNLTGGPNFQASDFPTPKDAMEARQFEIERRYQNFGRALDKYQLPDGRIIPVDATATKGVDSFDFGGQEAKYVGPMGPEDTIDPATGSVVQLDPSGRPKTEPPAGTEVVPGGAPKTMADEALEAADAMEAAGDIEGAKQQRQTVARMLREEGNPNWADEIPDQQLTLPEGPINDLRQQNGLEGITGLPTDEPVDLGQTPTPQDFTPKPPKTSIERPEIEYEQARIQATENPVFIERMTREYMGERRIAIRDKDWDRVHELDKQISQLAEQRSMIHSQLYPDTPLTPQELEKRGQQQLPGMAASMDSGRPLTDMPPQTPIGIPEERQPTQGQLPISRRPKIGRIPGLTIDKIKEAEASLLPDEWDPGLDHERGSRWIDSFTPRKGTPGLSVADINGDTAIGPHDIGQVVYRNPEGKVVAYARIEPMKDGSGKSGIVSMAADKNSGIQGRGVIAIIKKLVELDVLRAKGTYSSWTRDTILGLRDFIDDTGGWGDDNQLWENIKRRTGWGQGGQTQPPKLDVQGQPIKELNLLKELISFPGSANTTGDLSASGRQALPFIFTPEFWKAQWPQLKAGWSKDAFNRIQAQLEDLPLFRQRLDLTTGDLKPSLGEELGMKFLRASDHIDEREAAIASKWLETGGNIPGFSKAYGYTIGRYVRGSNRAYMTLLNHIRANRTQKLFDLSRDMSIKALETGEARPGFFKQKYTPQEALNLDPYTNKVLGKEIVDFVNTATGRGPLKMHVLPYRKAEISFEGAADKLGYLLFAPRMIASRMRMLNPSTYIMASPFVRKQYLKAALSTAAAWYAINQMGKIAGAETNDDPDSADYGKMRFGDMRLDPAGGFQQFLVAYHRLYTGGYSSSSTGQWHQFGKGFQAQTQYDSGERLFSNKLNPVAKFAWDVLNASEYQPFHVYDRTAQLFVPLIIQDVYELSKEDPSLLPLVVPIAFGMGTQIYSKGESVGKFIQPEDDWLASGGGLQDLLPEGWQQER